MAKKALIEGDLVEFDIHRLRWQAMPAYITGGGGGVDPKTIRAMLNRMIEVLGFPGTSEADNDLKCALQLVRQLLSQNEQRIRGAKSTLWRYESAMEDGDLESVNTELETLRQCIAPIDKVIVY